MIYLGILNLKHRIGSMHSVMPLTQELLAGHTLRIPALL